MLIRPGISGYAYKEWKGSFYPADLKADQMLGYYATQFPAVEINNTFYRMPKESVVLNWAEQVPDSFRFVLKASRRITHFGRLQNVESELEYFLRVASALGSKRGPTLFQLPPNLPADLSRLEAFLKLLPTRWLAAFEFRHPSWETPEVEQILAASGAALVHSDGEGFSDALSSTTDWGYLRLRQPTYTDEELAGLAGAVRRQPWRDAYVFVKHEGETAGPPLARRVMEALQAGSRE
jgi:uncharacterized protein YecE (DUF72 family)